MWYGISNYDILDKLELVRHFYGGGMLKVLLCLVFPFSTCFHVSSNPSYYSVIPAVGLQEV